MDRTLRELERQGDSPALRRAYQRAGMLKELNDLIMGSIVPWTLMEKARLWSRSVREMSSWTPPCKEPQGVAGHYNGRVGFRGEVDILRAGFHGPLQRAHRMATHLWHENEAIAPVHLGDTKILDLEGLTFRLSVEEPKEGSTLAKKNKRRGYATQPHISYRLQCPECKRFITFPIQFRQHLKVH